MGRFWWWRPMMGRCQDAGACAARAAGERAVPGGVHEQGGHGGRPGAAGPGGARGAGAVEEVPVSGGRDSGGAGVGAGGDGAAGGPEGERVHMGADGGGGQLHSDAGAGDRQAVFDADRGHLFDHGAGDGGDGAGGDRLFWGRSGDFFGAGGGGSGEGGGGGGGGWKVGEEVEIVGFRETRK